METEYFTLAEVADQLRVRPRWLRELVRERGIPVLRKGRVIRFDALALRALEETMRVPAKSVERRPPARAARDLPMDPDTAYAAALKALAPPAKKPAPARRKLISRTGRDKRLDFAAERAPRRR